MKNKITHRGGGNLQNVKYSTTAPIQIKLNPNWITGFVDGEGSFMISLRENSKSKKGWTVQALFSICLHGKDRVLLELIKSYFGGIGSIIEKKMVPL